MRWMRGQRTLNRHPSLPSTLDRTASRIAMNHSSRPSGPCAGEIMRGRLACCVDGVSWRKIARCSFREARYGTRAVVSSHGHSCNHYPKSRRKVRHA